MWTLLAGVCAVYWTPWLVAAVVVTAKSLTNKGE